MFRVFILIAVFPFILPACTDAEGPPEQKPGAEGLYLDYKIWAEEGLDHVTCIFQFRDGGSEGEALVVENPGKVELDGIPLPSDSTRFTGVYYETHQPFEAFVGDHEVELTTSDGKQFREEFSFLPFRLDQELPPLLPRQPFVIQLQNMPERETRIRVVITDTSFSTPDVNEIVAVIKGQVEIDESMLRNLSNGPLILELYREELRRLKNTPGQGGRISITYGLKRDVILGE
jgi:hypothetical protein